MGRDLGDRPQPVAVPLDRPVERPERQHADDRQIEVRPDRTGIDRLREQGAPEYAVGTLQLEMPPAHGVRHLSQDAQVRRRVGAVGQDDAQVGGDRGAQAGERLGARPQRGHGVACRGDRPVDADRQHLLDQRLLGVEVVVQAPRLQPGLVRDVLQRHGRVPGAPERPRRGVEDAPAGAVGLRVHGGDGRALRHDSNC